MGPPDIIVSAGADPIPRLGHATDSLGVACMPNTLQTSRKEEDNRPNQEEPGVEVAADSSNKGDLRSLEGQFIERTHVTHECLPLSKKAIKRARKSTLKKQRMVAKREAEKELKRSLLSSSGATGGTTDPGASSQKKIAREERYRKKHVDEQQAQPFQAILDLSGWQQLMSLSVRLHISLPYFCSSITTLDPPL